MTVASEIARIQGVKANILNAIAAKGVIVPSGAMLADCPNLISSISGGGGGFVIGGREYRTVVIGGKEWLAENLDFAFEGLTVGVLGGSADEPRANYYNNDGATYGWGGTKYGLLYNAPAVSALEAGKATYFPGWHVPTDADYVALFNAVGGASVAGKKLKSATGWDDNGGGDGTTGFDVVPSGYLQFYTFGDAGKTGRLRDVQGKRALFSGDSDSVDLTGANPAIQFSVRLVKDSVN